MKKFICLLLLFTIGIVSATVSAGSPGVEKNTAKEELSVKKYFVSHSYLEAIKVTEVDSLKVDSLCNFNSVSENTISFKYNITPESIPINWRGNSFTLHLKAQTKPTAINSRSFKRLMFNNPCRYNIAHADFYKRPRLYKDKLLSFRC